MAVTHDGWPTPCKSLALGELVGAHGSALVSRGVALGLLMLAQPSPGFSLWVSLSELRLLCTRPGQQGLNKDPVWFHKVCERARLLDTEQRLSVVCVLL